MKYLLTLHMNPATWATLTDEQKNGVFDGHAAFMKLVTESGEMVETKALAEPGDAKTVRVRDGVEVTEGLYETTPSYFCGYYVVDVESEARAVELAGKIPDARYTGVEVRKVVHEA